jgi:hypothetical protein
MLASVLIATKVPSAKHPTLPLHLGQQCNYRAHQAICSGQPHFFNYFLGGSKIAIGKVDIQFKTY